MIYKDRKETPIERKAKRTLGETFLPSQIDTTVLKTIPYQYPGRKITVELTTDEFSCLCPFSELPDYAHLTIKYIPRKKLIELKSLKYYLYAYRNVKIYNEHVVNKILEDLKKVLNPYEISILGEFSIRGGIKNKVFAFWKARR